MQRIRAIDLIQRSWPIHCLGLTFSYNNIPKCRKYRIPLPSNLSEERQQKTKTTNARVSIPLLWVFTLFKLHNYQPCDIFVNGERGFLIFTRLNPGKPSRLQGRRILAEVQYLEHPSLKFWTGDVRDENEIFQHVPIMNKCAYFIYFSSSLACFRTQI